MTAIQRVNWIIIQIWTCDRILKSWRKYISHVDLWPAIAMAVWEKVETERYLCIRIAKGRKSQLKGKCYAITNIKKHVEIRGIKEKKTWKRYRQKESVVYDDLTEVKTVENCNLKW